MHQRFASESKKKRLRLLMLKVHHNTGLNSNYLHQLRSLRIKDSIEGMSFECGKNTWMKSNELVRWPLLGNEQGQANPVRHPLKNALGGLDESSIDNIAHKIQQLNAYKMV